MHVALIWNADQRLVEMSVRYERFIRGFRELGHHPFAVSSAAAAEGFTEPVVTVPNRDHFRDPLFWRSLPIDVAVLVSWLGMAEVLAALRPVARRIVALADSDGQVGWRVHRKALFRRFTGQHVRWLDRVRAAKYWVQCVFYAGAAQDRARLCSADCSDIVVVGSKAARANLEALFVSRGRPDLAHKLAVVPYPVDDCYLRPAIRSERVGRMVAIGRWSDPQKDGHLLSRAIAHYLGQGGSGEFVLVGPGGEAHFSDLQRRFVGVRYLGVQPPEAIADLLSTSQSLLLTSRWESGPLVMSEALALGNSVVGPDWVPAMADLKAEHGSVFHHRTPAAVARAIAAEKEAWACGRRDPRTIADYWRPRLRPSEVCRQLLACARAEELPLVRAR